MQWTNKRTDEIQTLEKGIDPSWDHNPGQACKKHLDALVEENKQPPKNAYKGRNKL